MENWQEPLSRYEKMEKRARRILEVDADADEIAIKKAHWLKAMENRPDKHPGDAEAAARFRLLAAAYEFLVKKREPGNRFLDDEEEPLTGKYHENDGGYFCWWREAFFKEVYGASRVRADTPLKRVRNA